MNLIKAQGPREDAPSAGRIVIAVIVLSALAIAVALILIAIGLSKPMASLVIVALAAILGSLRWLYGYLRRYRKNRKAQTYRFGIRDFLSQLMIAILRYTREKLENRAVQNRAKANAKAKANAQLNYVPTIPVTEQFRRFCLFMFGGIAGITAPIFDWAIRQVQKLRRQQSHLIPANTSTPERLSTGRAWLIFLAIGSFGALITIITKFIFRFSWWWLFVELGLLSSLPIFVTARNILRPQLGRPSSRPTKPEPPSKLARRFASISALVLITAALPIFFFLTPLAILMLTWATFCCCLSMALRLPKYSFKRLIAIGALVITLCLSTGYILRGIYDKTTGETPTTTEPTADTATTVDGN